MVFREYSLVLLFVHFQTERIILDFLKENFIL